jgi:radical SAM protein with 4Fe4S-binding SPASM domain
MADSKYAERMNVGTWEHQMSRPHRSRRLDIELTERCNLNCIHCYINKPAGDRELQKREMSTDMIKETLSEAASLGKLRLLITGGEPMLRPDFSEIYLHARELGYVVQLFTNGTLITPQIADMFARVPPLGAIEISVYGMSPGSYGGVTGVPACHAALQRGLNLLLERDVRFLVRMQVLPPNRHEVEEFLAWARTIPGMENRPALGSMYKYRGRRDNPEKNTVIDDLRPDADEALAMMQERKEVYDRSLRQFCEKFLGVTGDRLFPCGAGLGGAIDPYGRLQPCLSLRKPDLCVDLHDHSITEALNEHFLQLREMRAENPAYLQRCAKCFLRSMCDMCPGSSWAENGTLDTPIDYYCSVAHRQALDLGLISEGEKAWEIEDWESRKPKTD